MSFIIIFCYISSVTVRSLVYSFGLFSRCLFNQSNANVDCIFANSTALSYFPSYDLGTSSTSHLTLAHCTSYRPSPKLPRPIALRVWLQSVLDRTTAYNDVRLMFSYWARGSLQSQATIPRRGPKG